MSKLSHSGTTISTSCRSQAHPSYSHSPLGLFLNLHNAKEQIKFEIAVLCLRTIRRSLMSDSTKTLVNAFVNSRLDYCNSLLYGIGEGLKDRLQRVQNAAARLVSGAKKYDHITPIMMDLHWLPIRRRVTFKVATLVYKCLHGCAPVYLADDCVAVSSIAGRRFLRSAAHLELTVPRTRTITSGPRAFPVCGPTVWNSLPCTLRSPELSYNCFRKKLKTDLFLKSY